MQQNLFRYLQMLSAVLSIAVLVTGSIVFYNTAVHPGKVHANNPTKYSESWKATDSIYGYLDYELYVPTGATYDDMQYNSGFPSTHGPGSRPMSNTSDYYSFFENGCGGAGNWGSCQVTVTSWSVTGCIDGTLQSDGSCI